MDFFLKVYIIGGRLTQSENEIRFCLTNVRRLGNEKSCIFDHRCDFFSRLYGRMVQTRHHLQNPGPHVFQLGRISEPNTRETPEI